MAGNRAAATSFIVKYIGKLLPGSENASIWKTKLEGMSDKEFASFIDRLETGEDFLSIIAPNFSKTKLRIENNLAIAEELGHNFFQRLWIASTGDTPTYLTPIPYMVLDMPVFRAAQMLTKKISVPKHNRVIDALTGQPTGESKGGRVSYPEVQLCAASGLDNCMIELLKYRGGDIKGNAALSGMLGAYGKASQSTLKQYASGVESTRTLKTFLTCMHLKSTL